MLVRARKRRPRFEVLEDRRLLTHGIFPVSTAIYRIPYVDGTDVRVSNDHHDHNPVDRIDMRVALWLALGLQTTGWLLLLSQPSFELFLARADEHLEERCPRSRTTPERAM